MLTVTTNPPAIMTTKTPSFAGVACEPATASRWATKVSEHRYRHWCRPPPRGIRVDTTSVGDTSVPEEGSRSTYPRHARLMTTEHTVTTTVKK